MVTAYTWEENLRLGPHEGSYRSHLVLPPALSPISPSDRSGVGATVEVGDKLVISLASTLNLDNTPSSASYDAVSVAAAGGGGG